MVPATASCASCSPRSVCSMTCDEVTRYADVGVAGRGVLRDQAAGQSLCLVETSTHAEHVALHRDGAVVVPAAGVFADLERALDGCGGGRAVLAVEDCVGTGQMQPQVAWRCSGSGLGGSLRHTCSACSARMAMSSYAERVRARWIAIS